MRFLGGDAWDVENPDFTLDDVAPTIPLAAVEAPRVDSATMEIPALNVAAPCSLGLGLTRSMTISSRRPKSRRRRSRPPPSRSGASTRRRSKPPAAPPSRCTPTMRSRPRRMTSDIPPPEPRKRSMLTPLLLLLLVAVGALRRMELVAETAGCETAAGDRPRRRYEHAPQRQRHRQRGRRRRDTHTLVRAGNARQAGTLASRRLARRRPRRRP